MVEKTNWFTGIGVISLLIGVFMIARVSLNIVIYSSYPSYGALPLSFSTIPALLQTEADCQSMMPYPMSREDPSYDPDLQAVQSQYDKENCLRSVRQQSMQTQYNDITLAAFFTFLGVGMILSRKFLPKIF